MEQPTRQTLYTMKLLVIPDIHLKHKLAERIVRSVPHDKVVFLGDYFDQFGDTAHENADCAIWLKESLQDPKRIHLFGNHDISYAFGDQFACSGFTRHKHLAISNILTAEDWAKLKWWHYEDSYLFSHAGFKYQLYKSFCSKQHISSNALTAGPDQVLKILNAAETWIKNDLKSGYYSEILAAGVSRGGWNPHGGLIWCDLGEFHPIPNINQIFGHTPVKEPLVLFCFAGNFQSIAHTKVSEFNSYPMLDRKITTLNYGIDSHLRHYAIIENGQVSIHEVSNLPKASS